MSQPIRIPSELRQLITTCDREAAKRLREGLRSRRVRVIDKLRELGLRDAEIGPLLGVTQQAIWQMHPRRTTASGKTST